MTNQTPLAAWRAERCVVDRRARCYTGPLFGDWVSWCIAQGQGCGTRITFTRALTKLGHESFIDSYARGLTGLRLRGASDAAPAATADDQMARLLGARAEAVA